MSGSPLLGWRRFGAPPRDLLAHAQSAVAVEAVFWAMLPLVIAVPPLCVLAALCAVASPLEGPGWSKPFRALSVVDGVRPIVLVGLGMVVALALLALNLFAFSWMLLWLAGGVSGLDLAPWVKVLDPTTSGLCTALLLTGSTLMVEPFWLATLVVLVQESRARASGEDLRDRLARLPDDDLPEDEPSASQAAPALADGGRMNLFRALRSPALHRAVGVARRWLAALGDSGRAQGGEAAAVHAQVRSTPQGTYLATCWAASSTTSSTRWPTPMDTRMPPARARPARPQRLRSSMCWCAGTARSSSPDPGAGRAACAQAGPAVRCAPCGRCAVSSARPCRRRRARPRLPQVASEQPGRARSQRARTHPVRPAGAARQRRRRTRRPAAPAHRGHAQLVRTLLRRDVLAGRRDLAVLMRLAQEPLQHVRVLESKAGDGLHDRAGAGGGRGGGGGGDRLRVLAQLHGPARPRRSARGWARPSPGTPMPHRVRRENGGAMPRSSPPRDAGARLCAPITTLCW